MWKDVDRISVLQPRTSISHSQAFPWVRALRGCVSQSFGGGGSFTHLCLGVIIHTYTHIHTHISSHTEHIICDSSSGKASVLEWEMECAMLLFCFLMSPLPSSPPSVACILVGGLHTSTAHCDSWKCAGNWVSPASPHALIWNSSSGNRSYTGSRLPGWLTERPIEFVGMEYYTDVAAQWSSSTPLGITIRQASGGQNVYLEPGVSWPD